MADSDMDRPDPPSTNLPDDTVDHVGEALAPPIAAGLSRMKS